MKDSTVPSFSISTEGNITIIIPPTQALVANQGYTYNQSGLTYNQIGVQYGGVYNYNQDLVPMLFTTNTTNPSAISFTDLYSIGFTRYLYAGMPMGLLLDLTYPVTIKIMRQL